MKSKTLKLMVLAAFALSALGRSSGMARAGGFDPPHDADERRMLFRRGAQLWPVYCSTCHNARPSAEFSPNEWTMILMHMRTQANLPALDARAVLEYLKSSK
jgi:hypothetical protein